MMAMGGFFSIFIMFLVWLVGVVFLVATGLAVYYYVAGKDEEYRRAKSLAVILLGAVFVLLILVALFMIPAFWLYP
ncbi:MAG TPA: hypothetical protein VLH18_01415 [Candidatus Limnocylindrales bacterium]|nr:hypothetical protein [Candidatus Limnocylindrales bacterium]